MTVTGRVQAVRMDPGGMAGAFISCPEEAVPGPGQFTLACDPQDPWQVLAWPLFPAGLPVTQADPGSRAGFWAAPPLPAAWSPGLRLALRGPLGRGYRPPAVARNLAMAALGKGVARLLPLLGQPLQVDGGMALFTDGPLPAGLPARVEVNPLDALPQALPWADYLALDLPLAALPGLRGLLRLPQDGRLPCPAQALVDIPMPCGGVAECGACAIPAGRGWKLACLDGPVFDLHHLSW